jgi:hypothetical protein
VILPLLRSRDCITDVDECRRIDVVALVVDVVVPLFLMELDASSKRLWQDSMNGPTPDVPIEDLFSLYRRTKVMMDMYHAFCPKSVHSAPTRSNFFDHPKTVVTVSLTLAASLSHMSDNGWSTRTTRPHNGSKP